MHAFQSRTPSPKAIKTVQRMRLRSPERTKEEYVGQYICVNNDSKVSHTERYLTADGVVCDSHINCRYIEHHEVSETFRSVMKVVAESITRFIDNGLLLVWIDGQDDCANVLAAGLWKSEDCGCCFMEQFLDGPGRFPWLAGLYFLGKEDEYRRSICYVNTTDDSEGIKDWVESLVSRAKGGSQVD
jgi:hypothetical protein